MSFWQFSFLICFYTLCSICLYVLFHFIFLYLLRFISGKNLLRSIIEKDLLRSISGKDLLRFEMSKNMSSGIFFCFDIWNPKLFTFKNRSSIVPSLQNIKNIQFLTILMSKNDIFEQKYRKIILTGVEIRKKLRWIRICSPFCLKPSKMISFWQFSFLSFFIFLHFSILLGSAAWGFSL